MKILENYLTTFYNKNFIICKNLLIEVKFCSKSCQQTLNDQDKLPQVLSGSNQVCVFGLT